MNLTRHETPAARRAGLLTLLSLAVCGWLAVVIFVLPHWADYRFYNWQMSVTRKPSYDARSLFDRVTGFPILHDIFTRMWFTVVVGLAPRSRCSRDGGPRHHRNGCSAYGSRRGPPN